MIGLPRHPTLADDAGTTMIEMAVAMVLLSVFLGIFTTAVLMVGSNTNKVEAYAVSASQINGAFLRLDRMLRYATVFTTPGRGSSGDWYVEADTNTTATGGELCTQLRVNSTTQQLVMRTWAPAGTGYTNLTGWTPLASSITNGTAAAGSADQPFVLPAAPSGTTSTRLPGLTVTLVAASNTATANTTRSSMSFSALNGGDASSTAVCGQAGRP